MCGEGNITAHSMVTRTEELHEQNHQSNLIIPILKGCFKMPFFHRCYCYMSVSWHQLLIQLNPESTKNLAQDWLELILFSWYNQAFLGGWPSEVSSDHHHNRFSYSIFFRVFLRNFGFCVWLLIPCSLSLSFSVASEKRSHRASLHRSV